MSLWKDVLSFVYAVSQIYSQMMRKVTSSFARLVLRPTQCEGLQPESSIHKSDDDQSALSETPALIQAADETKNKIKKITPMQFESLKNLLNQSVVNTYDGFRCQISKGLHQNAQVSHFYWMGSQFAPLYYQYRIILANDEVMANIATDLDFNSEGEIKFPLSSNKSVLGKVNFAAGDQNQNLTIDFDASTDSATGQFQIGRGQEASYSISYMQAINENLSLGGVGKYLIDNNTIESTIGGVYDKNDNFVAFQWDKEFKLLYTRRVNPNRTHLSAELTVDKESNGTASIIANYTLKQSRVNLSIDSDLTIKSSVESSISPGVNLQIVAETSQLNTQAKVGVMATLG